MDYFGLPQAYSEMLKALDGLGIDYLTLLEYTNGNWYVEGYIVSIEKSMRKKVCGALVQLMDKYGLNIKKQKNGIIIYNSP